jgi:cytochrome c553
MNTNNSFRRKFPLIIAVMGTASLIVVCGGGGDTDTVLTPTAQNNVAISGTVPGTTIQAYCTDGSSPSVQSTDDGSNEPHPFSLELPVGVNCRVIMITNEGTTDQVITNITFNGNSIINLESSLPLGHIALAMSPDDMVDANNDGFAEMDLDIGTVSGVAIYNLSYDPTDIDGDGIANALDSDMDGDAIDDDQDIDLTVTNDSDGDGIDDSIDRDFVTAVAVETLPLSYTPVRGRLLASQCFQCHGTNGNSVTHWDSISGESASENLEEMNEYSVSHIMGAQVYHSREN